jgi:pimeloyl-ACP methyl ester carboxylesterase
LPTLVNKLGTVSETPMPLHASLGHVGAIESHDTTGILGSILSRTQVVIGDQEWLNPLPDANELVEGIPDAQLQVITGASHGLIVE